MFLDTSEIFEKVVTNLQHAYSTVVELVTFCSDRRFFGGADDKFSFSNAWIWELIVGWVR